MAGVRPPVEAPGDDEHTPLLSDTTRPDEIDSPTLADQSVNGAPVGEDNTWNRNQILLLSFIRLADPMAFFSIVPFINQMIFEFDGIKEEDVGFYSGLVESMFSVVQTLCMIPYGRLADRLGRKPVLCWSVFGMACTTTLFGFSTRLWQIIALRCAAGFFSGSVVAVRTMISENSTPKTQAAAFSIWSFFGNIGIFAGTLVGGLAQPELRFPGTVGKIILFRSFPYAFPTVIAGCIIFSAFFVALLFITETSHKHSKDNNQAQLSTWEVVRSPGVPIVLVVWSLVGLLGFAYTAVAPVFWFTSVELGGFGFSPSNISYFLALGGLCQALWMIIVFPVAQPRLGTGFLLRICGGVWPFLFASNPVANAILRSHVMKPLFWTLAVITVSLGSGVAMAFTGAQLAVNDISPSPSALGTLNGVALSLNAAVRAVAPGLFSAIFATGVKYQILAGQLAWIIMVACALVFNIAIRYLPSKLNRSPLQRQHTNPEHATDEGSQEYGDVQT